MRLIRSCCLAVSLVIAISGLGSETADIHKLDESLLKATADGAVDQIKSLLSRGASQALSPDGKYFVGITQGLQLVVINRAVRGVSQAKSSLRELEFQKRDLAYI